MRKYTLQELVADVNISEGLKTEKSIKVVGIATVGNEAFMGYKLRRKRKEKNVSQSF